MEQVKIASGADIRITRGDYTAGMLRRSPHRDLVATVVNATTAMCGADRLWEDASRPVTLAYADRDYVRLTMEETVSNVRHDLAGSSRDAIHERPYTDVLPEGMTEVTRAEVDDVAKTYGLLVARAEKYLPADHPVRMEHVPVLRQQIEEWKAAEVAIEAAEAALELVRIDRANAIADWDAAYLEVYGVLLGRLKKKSKAERFFMRSRARKKTGRTAQTEAPATPEVSAAPTPEDPPIPPFPDNAD
jgi:hypothetical protein